VNRRDPGQVRDRSWQWCVRHRKYRYERRPNFSKQPHPFRGIFSHTRTAFRKYTIPVHRDGLSNKFSRCGFPNVERDPTPLRTILVTDDILTIPEKKTICRNLQRVLSLCGARSAASRRSSIRMAWCGWSVVRPGRCWPPYIGPLVRSGWVLFVVDHRVLRTGGRRTRGLAERSSSPTFSPRQNPSILLVDRNSESLMQAHPSSASGLNRCEIIHPRPSTIQDIDDIRSSSHRPSSVSASADLDLLFRLLLHLVPQPASSSASISVTIDVAFRCRPSGPPRRRPCLRATLIALARAADQALSEWWQDLRSRAGHAARCAGDYIHVRMIGLAVSAAGRGSFPPPDTCFSLRRVSFASPHRGSSGERRDP